MTTSHPTPSPPPLPSVPTELVSTPKQLAAVCAHLRAAGTFAFDTEFIGENTYVPILCLIQVATPERVDLIDPMAIDRDDMQVFWDLLADASLEKICHAGDQDVEIAWQHSRHTARNMFDTQIGAGMLGISYPTALWRAVEHFTGVTLEKAHTYSAWDRRPLTAAQFSYAVDDVRYLPGVHAAMKARLEANGHLAWMHAACDEMCADNAKPTEPRKIFLRIKGASGLGGQQLAVLREVTALREQIAYEHDVPARAFLKDDVLLDMATRMPSNLADLARIRDMPREDVDSYGKTLLAAIAAGANDPDRPTIFVPGEDSAEVKRLSETLSVAAQVICLGQSVTPGLVTTQNEILAIAREAHRGKSFEQHALMRGWHGECLGKKLAAFVRGEMKVDLSMVEESLRADFLPRG